MEKQKTNMKMKEVLPQKEEEEPELSSVDSFKDKKISQENKVNIPKLERKNSFDIEEIIELFDTNNEKNNVEEKNKD